MKQLAGKTDRWESIELWALQTDQQVLVKLLILKTEILGLCQIFTWAYIQKTTTTRLAVLTFCLTYIIYSYISFLYLVYTS